MVLASFPRITITGIGRDDRDGRGEDDECAGLGIHDCGSELSGMLWGGSPCLTNVRMTVEATP